MLKSWCIYWWSILSFFIALAAIFYRLNLPYEIPPDIKIVIKSLIRSELSWKPLPQRTFGPHVIVGFGSCLDLKVKALRFLTLIEDAEENFIQDLTGRSVTSELNTVDDVIYAFSESFKAGAAVERVLHNVTLFNVLVDIASNLVSPALRDKYFSTISTEQDFLRWLISIDHNDVINNEDAWWSLGGNAPVMALRLAREGAQVTLAARLSSRQRSALPPDMQVLVAPPSFDLPELPEDDVHLILEYKTGEQWRNIVSPRANRFIVLHDKETPLLSSLWPGLMDTWHQHLVDKLDSGASATADLHNPHSPLPPVPSIPDLFVLSGLQVMDNWNLKNGDTDQRLSRLSELDRFLSQLPSQTLVHFEMASFVDHGFATEMLRRVMPHVDSIGLNEQEIPNLSSLLSGGPISSISTTYPRAAHMLDSMRAVWALTNDPSLPRVPSASGSAWRRLSRIHLHTLAYQIIMVRRHCDGGGAARKELNVVVAAGGLPPRKTDVGIAWPFTRAAVAKASLIAHRHTCASSTIDPVQTRLLMDDSFAVTADLHRWKSALQSRGSNIVNDAAQTPRIRFNSTAPVTCWREPEPDLSGWSELNRTLQHSSSSIGGRGTGSKFNTEIEICVAPVLVCSTVKATVGAGDNISAGALRVQLASSRST